MNWQQLKRWILPVPGGTTRLPAVATGLYHFRRETRDGYVRYHLRVEPDGHGLLFAAASEAVRLSPEGAALAKGLLDGGAPANVARQLGVPQAEPAVEQLKDTIDQLGQPSGRYPIFNLDDPLATGRSRQLMAPFQADIVPKDRDTTFDILGRLWDAGIPHVRFVVADALDVSFVAEAIRRAEDLGMIAGVRAPMSKLAAGDTMVQFSDMGLDYLVVPWVVTPALHELVYGGGDYEQLGDALREARRLEMCPVVEIPLFVQSEDALEENVDRLVAWDVENIELFAIAVPDTSGPSPGGELQPFAAQQLRQIATWSEDLAAERPFQLIWLPPVVPAAGQSVAQAAHKGPRAGGDTTIRVEADGSVVPPRGPRLAAGNILKQPWSEIWQQSAFRRYREHVEHATRCDACPGLAICAADCPADPTGWANESGGA